MSSLARLLLVLAAISFVLAMNPAYLPEEARFDTPEADIDAPGIESAVHAEVNELRLAEEVRLLVSDDELAAIGRYHSTDMAERGYIGHDSPDGEGVRDRYERFDYDCRIRLEGNDVIYGGENVFVITFGGAGYTNEDIAERAMEGWMNSTGHRQNLLAEHWYRQGIGVAILEEGDNTSVYVTQNFC
ncbi:CAP domain-containing protein [Haloarchaeobius sp. DFWS5]|uniref:CAP domain-containing protein n=1 Tax=Haloarchaeobius sp. DFWS5 TaxID=3446114 RepID=UPI003EB6B4CC